MTVSNKTLATLVGVVLVISVISLGMTAIRMTGGVSATGAVTGTTQVNVGAVVAISLPTNTVDFGNMNTGESNQTNDDSPFPFTVQNDGSVDVNVTINASDLWDGTGAQNPSVYYRYHVAASTEGTCYDSGDSVTSYTNMPASATLAIANLTYGNGCDLAEVEINVTVPGDESSGAKSSTVWFLATQY